MPPTSVTEIELERRGAAPQLPERPTSELKDEPGRSDIRQAARPTWAGFALASVGLALIAILALLGYGLLRRQGGSFGGFAVNTVGKVAEIRARPASEFALAVFDGATFRLSEHWGRVVGINFWALWCPPCREEARILESASRDFRDRASRLLE